ncbi:hypothetical protein [Streptomyces sp. NBC_00233]|uniref:hypothetical protein n=1 Tax=Streptomyces sp. NBC_00233 TaxID=2975686 RepID=UPI00224E1853|nr:hypothetical protein [Streptomyces sp. NBC_00233]MCX5230901.1 hypothetical protein [Streptomyces sp. NBC_00233]
MKIEGDAVAAGHSVNPAHWQEAFEGLMSRIAGRFTRVESRRRARKLVLGFADKAVLGLAGPEIVKELGLTRQEFGTAQAALFSLLSLSALGVSFLTRKVRTSVLLLVMGALWSAAQLLRRHAQDLRRSSNRLILAGVEPGLARSLKAAGLDRELGPEGIVPAGGALFDPLDHAMAIARAWIASRDRAPGRD